jgi:hypothetical protein
VKSIFLVAVLHSEKSLRYRTWGWYESFEDAETAVFENHTDIFECGYYDLAVIEEMPEGVMAFRENEWWYKAEYKLDNNTPVVTKCPKPEQLEGFVNFTM